VLEREFSNDSSNGEDDCPRSVTQAKVIPSTKATMHGSGSGPVFRYRNWTGEETRCLKDAVLKVKMQ